MKNHFLKNEIYYIKSGRFLIGVPTSIVTFVLYDCYKFNKIREMKRHHPFYITHSA
jgi:hypothetical protein